MGCKHECRGQITVSTNILVQRGATFCCAAAINPRKAVTSIWRSHTGERIGGKHEMYRTQGCGLPEDPERYRRLSQRHDQKSEMNKPPEFTAAQATALARFLGAAERLEDTMSYCELAGFLFAVACSPEMVPPSEWLPLVFNDPEGGFETQDQAQEILTAIMALYNHVNHGVLERKPLLPPGCPIQPDPLANLDADAPLSQWARGFADGHDWLVESWDEYALDEWDEELGVCLMVLSFFCSRELAQAYRKEFRKSRKSLQAMATEALELMPEAMASYAHMGRSIYEALLPQRPRR
jgi:uncharacterized protein